MPGTPNLELPFDAYQRYQLVADLVRRYPMLGPATSVLDVGGRTALMRGFLPELRVDLVDVEAANEAGLVIGSGAALPFRDGTFDIVTACDTLEHVPPALRGAFVRECARVSKGWVVFAGPYESEAVRAAEADLRAFLKRKLDLDHRYLNEHEEHGLPCRDATEREFDSAGCQVTSVGHASLQRWLPLMCLEMYMDSDPHLREVAKRYFRVYNQTLYASDHAGPVYRHAVVAAKPGVALPSTEGLFTRPVAPPEALELFGELTHELVAFDRERDVYQAERDRLRAVNDGLAKDLREHRTSLATARADLAAHADSLRHAREDLARHRESLTTVKTDLREHAAALGKRTELHAEEQAARIAAEREMNEHRAVLQQLKHTCNEQKLVVDDLERDLIGNRETVTALRDELRVFRSDHTEMVAALQSEVEAHRSVMHAQHRELAAQGEALAVQSAEHERQRSEWSATRERLETELVATRARMETELSEARDALERKVEELFAEHRKGQRDREQIESLEQQLRGLREELEDRWRCFRRAIEIRRQA